MESINPFDRIYDESLILNHISFRKAYFCLLQLVDLCEKEFCFYYC